MNKEMTPQEAIKRIENHIEIHSRKEPHAFFITKALKLAVKALEKQIPKKPIVDSANLVDLQDFHCPKCNQKIIARIDGEWIAGKQQNYCDKCGQAIDWSDTE